LVEGLATFSNGSVVATFHTQKAEVAGGEGPGKARASVLTEGG